MRARRSSRISMSAPISCSSRVLWVGLDIDRAERSIGRINMRCAVACIGSVRDAHAFTLLHHCADMFSIVAIQLHLPMCIVGGIREGFLLQPVTYDAMLRIA